MISCSISSWWYHHVWCILYTNNVINHGTMLCIVPGSGSVACSPIFTSVSCERDGLWAHVLDTCSSSSGEAWVLVLLLTNLYPQLCGTMMYILSCATDRPRLSVGRPAGMLAYFCQWVLLHDWRMFMWRSVKMMSRLGSSRLLQGFIKPIPIFFDTNSCNF